MGHRTFALGAARCCWPVSAPLVLTTIPIDELEKR
jgi:hypothetical protein